MSLPPWPQYEPDEIEAAVSVLRSGLVNAWTGSDCADFEAAFARKFDASHGLTLANGSLALEAALIACGIGEGDDVLVTPRSFMASVSCVMLRQARPVFADVDRDSQNLTVETLEAARTPRTRAAIVVHLAGWPCDMPAIMAWADEHGIKILIHMSTSFNNPEERTCTHAREGEREREREREYFRKQNTVALYH